MSNILTNGWCLKLLTRSVDDHGLTFQTVEDDFRVDEGYRNSRTRNRMYIDETRSLLMPCFLSKHENMLLVHSHCILLT